MKIGVFSDTHLGRAVPRAIGDLRRKAFRHAFSEALKIFVEERVDYVIHGGDLFERSSMTPDDARFVKEEFHAFSEALPAVKLFMVRGNHDGTLSPESSVLSYVTHPLAKYLVVLGDVTLEGKEEGYVDDKIRVCGIGYYPYIARRFERASEAVNRVLGVQSGFKIVILHNFLHGYHQVPPGTPRQGFLTLDDVRKVRADLVVAGHYHRALSPLGLDGMLLLTPGGTDAIDLADEGEHGVYVVEVNGEVRAQFRAIQPLQAIKNILVESEEPRPVRWFIQRSVEDLNRFSEELMGKRRECILRLLLKGLSRGDPMEIDVALESEQRRLRGDNPFLLHFEMRNDVEEERKPMAEPTRREREPFLEEVFSELGPLEDEAISIVQDVDAMLEEKQRVRRGLLSASDRVSFKKRWTELLEKTLS